MLASSSSQSSISSEEGDIIERNMLRLVDRTRLWNRGEGKLGDGPTVEVEKKKSKGKCGLVLSGWGINGRFWRVHVTYQNTGFLFSNSKITPRT